MNIQIRLDLQLQSIEQKWDESKTQRLRIVDQYILDQCNKSKKYNVRKNQRSRTEIFISKVLEECGVMHECEVDLDGTDRPVDVFIPAGYFNSLYSTKPKQNDFKGVVIEFNGPYHFDTYTKVSLSIIDD